MTIIIIIQYKESYQVCIYEICGAKQPSKKEKKKEREI